MSQPIFIWATPIWGTPWSWQPRLTTTLVPLDISSHLSFTYDFLEQLPSSTTRAGRFLRRVMPYAFRSHRRCLGLEGIHLHDAVALVAVTNPELFSTDSTAGDVEIGGELTTGATIFDRRQIPQWRPNMDVAVELDVAGARDVILRGLQRAGEAG